MNVYKKENRKAHFLPQGKNNLNKEELAALKDKMKTRNIDRPEEDNMEPTVRNRFELAVKDLNTDDIADLLICTYDLDQHECSSDQRHCWE